MDTYNYDLGSKIEKEELLYTVIIPHFNDVESLKVMIRSIPDRTDIQIIVVDDNTFPQNEQLKKVFMTYQRLHPAVNHF